MKKIIGYILTVLLVMQTISAVHAQEVISPEEQATVSHQQNLLNLIGIDISTEDSIINRGEFAVLTAKLMGDSVTVSDTSSSFADISEYYLYKNEIEVVKKQGLMTGYGDKFEPINPITMQEALKVLVTLAGYGELAEKKGGYPTGYINVASALKLTKGIKCNYYEGFDAATAYKLAFNLLEVPDFEVVSITSEGDVEYSQSEDTYGKKHFGLLEISGRITANSVSALSGYSVAPENSVTIGNTIYQAASYIGEYLGQYVDTYVREIDNNEYEVIYCEIDDNMEYIRINKEDVISVVGFDASDAAQYKRNPKLVYTNTNGRSTTLTIGGNLEVAYNSVITTDIKNEDFTSNSGYIDIIDTNNDRVYDFISITNYVNYVVERVDIANSRLVFKNGAGTLTIDDQEIVVITHGNRTINYNSILKDTVLSIRTAKVKSDQTISDSPVIYMDMSTASIEGEASVLDTEENEITVNGKVYEYDEIIEDDIILAVPSKYLLDVFGRICYIEKLHTGVGEYYFFTKSALKGSLSKKLQFQFVNMKGEVVVFDMPEKITYTGPDKNGDWTVKARCDQDKMVDIFSANFTGRHLLKLVVIDGNIEEIIAPVNGTTETDYPGYSEEFSLERVVMSGSLAPHDYCIDNVYRFDAGIPLIVNNVLGDAEDVIIRKTAQNLGLSGLQSVEVYDATEELEAGMIVAHVSNASGDTSQDWSIWEQTLFVVDKMSYVKNEDDNFDMVLHGYENGMYTSYACAEENVKDNFANSPFIEYSYKTEFKDLSRGDVIMLEKDNDDKITGFMSVFTFDGKNIPTDYRFKTGNGSDWGAVLVTYYDQIGKCYDRTFTLKSDPNKIIPILGNIYMYDMEKDELKKLSFDEAYGLFNGSDAVKPDFALVRQRRSQQLETIIYRR